MIKIVPVKKKKWAYQRGYQVTVRCTLDHGVNLLHQFSSMKSIENLPCLIRYVPGKHLSHWVYVESREVAVAMLLMYTPL